MRLIAAIVLACIAVAGLTLGIASGAARNTYEDFTPDAECGACHAQIQAEHMRSGHGLSEVNPVFQALEHRAASQKASNSLLCQPCHRPMSSKTAPDDEDLDEVFGVGCHFCHSITGSANSIRPGGYPLAVGHYVTGPHEDRVSPTHRITPLPLFKEAEFCRGCHQWSNRQGTVIYDEYAQWESSPAAAEGKTCQDCHMTLNGGPEVKQTAIGGPLRESVRPHTFWGAENPDTKEPPVSLDFDLLLAGDTIDFTANLADVTAAHAFPAGSPLHAGEIRLEVLDSEGRVIDSASAWARRVFDLPADRASDFWDAPSVVEDTRVPAGGSREYKLKVRFSEAARELRVSLLYHRVHLPDRPGPAGMELPARTLYQETFPLADLLELEG